MTKTGTIVKAMRAVLVVMVLTPATAYADPLSTRQMLAQAQTQSQDQAVQGEIKKINRGLILGTAEAAESPNANAQRPIVIPAISAPTATAPTAPPPTAKLEAPPVDLPPLPTAKVEAPVFETAAAPAPATTQPQTVTPSIVTLPAPPVATDMSTPVPANASTADVAAAIAAPVTPVSPATDVQTPAITSAPVDAANTTAVKVDTVKVDTTSIAATSATKTTSTKTANAQASHQRRTHVRNDDGLDIGGFSASNPSLDGGNIGGQLQKIINRPEVKSVLAQYGLN